MFHGTIQKIKVAHFYGPQCMNTFDLGSFKKRVLTLLLTKIPGFLSKQQRTQTGWYTIALVFHLQVWKMCDFPGFFQDFPGHEIFRKEMQDFPGGVRTLQKVRRLIQSSKWYSNRILQGVVSPTGKVLVHGCLFAKPSLQNVVKCPLQTPTPNGSRWNLASFPSR